MNMKNNHMKRYSTSYIVRSLKIKAKNRYNYIPIRMIKNNKNSLPISGEDAEQKNLLSIASGNAKSYSHFGKPFGSLLQS